jgi:acetyl-CoA acetyltransferase
MDDTSIVIVGAARTAQGNLLGALKDLSATQLGSAVITAAMTGTPSCAQCRFTEKRQLYDD